MRWNSRWSQERRTWWVPKIWPPNHWREGLSRSCRNSFLVFSGRFYRNLGRRKNALWITGIVLFPCQAREDAKNAPPEACFLTFKMQNMWNIENRISLDWLDKLDCECSRLQHPRRRGKANKAQAKTAKTAKPLLSSALQAASKWNSSAWWIFVNPHDAGIPPNARGSHFDRLTSFRHCNLIQFHLSAKYSTNVSKGFVKSESHGYDFCFLMVMLFSVKVLC